MTAINDIPSWSVNEDEVESTILRPDISCDESQNMYRIWAKAGTYDEVLGDPHKYTGLIELMDSVKEFVTNKEALILDCGAGTGLNGKFLSESGYKNIHALEPVSGFEKALLARDAYDEILHEYLGRETPTSVQNDSYDVVVSTGSFGPGCMPPSAIPEMVRIVKPGGYIIISMRHEFCWTVPQYKDKLEPMWDKLVEEKKWKLIKRKIYPNHFVNRDGLVVVYQVC